MKFSVKALLGLVSVLLMAANSHAGFLDGLFKKHEDCKKPYLQEVDKCRTNKMVNAAREWGKQKEWKKVDEVMDECIDNAYKELLECRLKKSKLKKGKKKGELQAKLGSIADKEKKDNDKCLSDWMKQEKKSDDSYEKFYLPCQDRVKKEALKAMINVLDEYVQVSGKGEKREEVKKSRK